MTDFNSKENVFVWADIPVVELDRAVAFYQAVTASPVHKERFEQFEFAVFDHQQGNGGCLIPAPEKVTDKGPLLYLNVDGRIRDAAEQVERHGGKLEQAVQSIGPHGYRAVFIDSEGNRLALHSQSDQ